MRSNLRRKPAVLRPAETEDAVQDTVDAEALKQLESSCVPVNADPAGVNGSLDQVSRAYRNAFVALERRISLFRSLLSSTGVNRPPLA